MESDADAHNVLWGCPASLLLHIRCIFTHHPFVSLLRNQRVMGMFNMGTPPIHCANSELLSLSPPSLTLLIFHPISKQSHMVVFGLHGRPGMVSDQAQPSQNHHLAASGLANTNPLLDQPIYRVHAI